MVTVVFAATVPVVIVKVGDAVAPAAIVTEAGTVTLELLLLSATMTPPAGAGPFIVTLFALVETPPLTEAGESRTELRLGGVTVKFAVLVTPL